MDVSGMLNTVCTVRTLTVSRDAIGGVSESYAERASNIPCRIRALSGNEVPALGSDRSNSTHRVYMQPSQSLGTITDKDRIVSQAGRILDVVFVNDVDESGELLQIDCMERKNG